MRAIGTSVLSLVGGLDKVFIIPPFQRNYDWSYDQCDELFDDIVKAYKTNTTHYLGNIVYYMGKNSGASFNELILVDGQQRITTILLLLCAIRDYSKQEDLKINSRYLINDTDIEKFRIKLKQTSYDYDSFAAVIDGRNLQEVDQQSNVVKNYKRFIELIKNSEIEPKNIYDTIQKLEVVDVNLEISDDLGKVQTVFEKINSTGKKLQPSDLIRNYLLLAPTSAEQEKLYNNYWTKLEQQLGNDNISKFAKYYLITKLYEDVQNDNIYKSFKEYFDSNNSPHLEILNDMLKYSEFYSWIINENCPDEKLNITIEILNLLKTDDLYPLYFILFEKLYSYNTEELRKIMNLISDFMLRYRIVSPSGGGGALRSSIYGLVEKIVGEIIPLNYDSILFELSNSPTPASRFPSNEEFKNQLKNSVYIAYARALLYKMELIEKSNIPVKLNKITIEHLMPQTRTKWWIDYLGGEEETDRIYNTYLNCIGNLALISGSYNSKNSNKPWNEKVENLKNVQFVITSSTALNSTWKEQDIINRNEDISERACNEITGPLKREREYESREATSEFETGIYSLSDIVTPMSGTTLENLIYDGKEYNVKKWFELLPMVCEILYDIDSNILNTATIDNTIHKATSKQRYNEKDPILSNVPNYLVTPIKLKNANIYVEGCLSSDRTRYYLKQILDLYGLADRFQICVRN